MNVDCVVILNYNTFVMNKETLKLINKLLNLAAFAFAGYLLVNYSHTFNGVVERLTGFLLGVVSLAHTLPPILALIKSDDVSVKKDD